MSQHNIERTMLLVLSLLALSTLIHFTSALPSGASILSNVSQGVPSSTAGNRSDPRGTINIIILSTLQQDQNWKGYVGNITGKLSLDNAAGATLYDWALPAINKSGQVYITRASTPVFTNISCADMGNITVEEAFNNMTGVQTDNIRNTFNYTNHQAFFVGTTPIGINTCKSTATYRNDSRANNPVDGNQLFQELLLMDSSDNIIFTSILSPNTGFDNQPYDFQIIVPESSIKVNPTMYYFYTQLG